MVGRLHGAAPLVSREQMKEQRGEVEVEGGTVRYRVLGEGEPTLVLLHGGPGGGSLYLKPLERLAGQSRRVVTYDQLGCGESDRPADPSLWRADRFVDELEALRAHLDLEKDRKSTRLNSSHMSISYAVFCLKKKKKN